MIYLIYFSLGIIEQFLAIMYYKTASKNYDVVCAFIDGLRGFIWLFVISSLIDNVTQNIPFGMTYVIGGSVGDYISLKLETRIEKYILRIKHRGRRKKRWYLQGDKKE